MKICDPVLNRITETHKCIHNIPEYTTVAVILRSFNGVQAAKSVLQAGNMTPSPQPTIIRSMINNVDPPTKYRF